MSARASGARRTAHSAQRTASSARRSKHGAQAKDTTQLPPELVYVHVETTKFNDRHLTSANGQRQLVLGLRLASRYPIQVDHPEGPGVREGSSTGPTGPENQTPRIESRRVDGRPSGIMAQTAYHWDF